MEEGKPSITAMTSAMARASHLLWDEPPKIFEDTFALRLSGCDSEATLRAQLEMIDAEIARSTSPEFALTLRRAVTAILVMRSRYLEDEVEKEVRRRVFQ